MQMDSNDSNDPMMKVMCEEVVSFGFLLFSRKLLVQL
jgi:hypothetical protein